MTPRSRSRRDNQNAPIIMDMHRAACRALSTKNRSGFSPVPCPRHPHPRNTRLHFSKNGLIRCGYRDSMGCGSVGVLNRTAKSTASNICSRRSSRASSREVPTPTMSPIHACHRLRAEFANKVTVRIEGLCTSVPLLRYSRRPAPRYSPAAW